MTCITILIVSLQVATALYDLHSNEVVHCDVKPANLAFFPMEHRWKLLDIDSAMEVGVAGDIFTTISYASPEVLEAVNDGQTELVLQASNDMWAYGIIAFEVFTRTGLTMWFRFVLMEVCVQRSDSTTLNPPSSRYSNFSRRRNSTSVSMKWRIEAKGTSSKSF